MQTTGRRVLAWVTVAHLAWSFVPIVYTVFLSFNKAPVGSYWGWIQRPLVVSLEPGIDLP